MMTQGTLILSSARGRYALRIDGEEHGDLTAGQVCEINLGGQWVHGCIEYDHDEIYVLLGPQRIEEVAQMAGKPRAIGGYYFEADGGGITGLCVGMQVRIP